MQLLGEPSFGKLNSLQDIMALLHSGRIYSARH